jgi:hypothetical protein
VGFLLNLSFPAEARHVTALHDVIVQAVRQAGGADGPARRLAEQAASILHQSANGQPGSTPMTMMVHLGPPIQVTIAGQTLTLENLPAAGLHEHPAEGGRHAADPE